MKLVRLDSIFDVKYGHSLELNKLTITSKDNGVAFISRRGGDNGVDCYVEPLDSVAPNSTGDITCALGGSVLATFLQERPYYTAFHVACLTSRIKLSKSQLLFYVACIGSNRYKYSYGRQANKTIKELLIPDFSEIPKWVNKTDVELPTDTDSPATSEQTPLIDTKMWESFRYDEIFSIERGESHYLKNLRNGAIPYVSASSSNNGISAYVSIKNQDGNSISLAYDGSIGEAFYQSAPYLASEKIAVLKLHEKWKVSLNVYISMFLITLIRKEKYRYNYGLKWSINSRLLSSIIKLPVSSIGSP